MIYKGLFLAESLALFYPDLQDERFVSSFALFHQRYSTNTMPSWKLAQPFRTLAHNGEINTLRGNVNWMKSHETRMVADAFGEHNEDVKPIIQPGGSDSAALDAVCEALVRAGRPLPLVKTMLIPPAWSHRMAIDPAHRDLFGYCNCVMEPWDGPAAIVATDSRWVVAGLDRSGLRPMRYSRTRDGLLVVGSETGMVPLVDSDVVEKGRVGPGENIAVDLVDRHASTATWSSRTIWRGRSPTAAGWRTSPISTSASAARPFTPAAYERAELRRRQALYGLTIEDMELILAPMVLDAKEAVGSMGDDTPLAVLSRHYRGLHHFFRQQFSQVTNPPIDPLREWRVMSLKTRFGNLGNVYDEDPSQTRILQLESPGADRDRGRGGRGAFRREPADASTAPSRPAATARCALALERIRQEAEEAVRGGCETLILSDEAVGPDRVADPDDPGRGCRAQPSRPPGPAQLQLPRRQAAASASTSHYFAVLIGVGATAVNAYLAEAAIADRHARGLFPGLELRTCLARFKEAINQGLLKVMSKMGISIISSYRGGYNFEAVGLSRSLCREYFPGLTTRISGIGLNGIKKKVRELHARAFAAAEPPLAIGGFYRYRRGGETHTLEAKVIHQLQHAVATDSYHAYKKFAEMLQAQDPISIRDLLDFNRKQPPVPLDEVESITEIRKRFVTPGMSLGALGPRRTRR